MTRHASEHGLVPSVLTFDPHPAAVVGTGAPPLLTTAETRGALLHSHGVVELFVRTFDVPFSQMRAENFVHELVVGTLGASAVAVGSTFRFGHARSGDLSLLRTLASTARFAVLEVPPIQDEVGPYSSSRIREHIQRGQLEDACALLGRPHLLSGTVVHGDKRGRTLGFPTANLEGVLELTPPNGVYAVRVHHGGVKDEGVMNIGTRPSFGGMARTIEVHLFDFEQDLYGQKLEILLVARLREERRFASLDELRGQIAKDAENARTCLAREMCHSAGT